MVKSAPPVAVCDRRISTQDAHESEKLAQLTKMLHEEGMALAQKRRLSQRHAVSPLQLHSVEMLVDPALTNCGASVAVLTDKHGQTALEVARYRSHWQVTGWVPDMKSFLQLQTRNMPENVIFDKMPTSAAAKSRPLDKGIKTIIACAWAHRRFSENNYHVSSLVQGLREMLALLPDGGQIILQDFALPDDSESFVTLDIENDYAALELQEFAKVARPNVESSLQGFFIETLPSPRDGVTRFHLPYKWAVEFFHRWRMGIACDAPFDLTTLSLGQWTSLVEQCGARVTYRTPHFIGRVQAKKLMQEMRFADAQGQAMELPAASFTMVIEKLPQTKPLNIYERRVSAAKAKDILISSLRHQENDEKLDVVEMRHHEDDLLPWYFDAQKRLHVLVRADVPRPVINAVPRGTPNLDGRYWAGYLIEPLVMPAGTGEPDAQIIADYFRNLMPDLQTDIGKATLGVEYYPAPEYLVQRVRGCFLPLKPRANQVDITGICTILNDTRLGDTKLGDAGRVLDVLADDILRAISAGLIPDGKLEILISRLMIEQGIQPEMIADISEQIDVKRRIKVTKEKREAKIRRSVKTGEHMEAFIADESTENLRAVRSVFVQEHLCDAGRQIANMHEHDFILPSALSTNTAVCVPVMADPVGKFLLSGEPRKLPIPYRLGTQEPMMHLPAFSLPFHVKTLDQARVFLASQLQCDPDDLFTLGPSFFTQSQISAERIYPFLLNATPRNARWMRWFRPLSRGLNRLVTPQVEKTTAYLEFKAARQLGEWYQGFSPDMVQKSAMNQNTSPFDNAAASPHLDRHPMIIPNMK